MGMKLGKPHVSERLGTQDAFHVPGIVAYCSCYLRGGQSVKFINEITVEPCELHERHGVADPLIKDEIGPWTNFWVLLDPEYVGEVSHDFDIKLPFFTPVCSKPPEYAAYVDIDDDKFCHRACD